MPKITELSSREDFIIEQFATIKKVNTIASRYFDAYYIDIDHDTELSPMMRSMIPVYYVDPNNPFHPSCFVLAGQSTIPFLERIVHIFPFMNKNGKYEWDISAYHGLLMNAAAFTSKTKGFRKTKLEPMVIVGKKDGRPFNKNLILREGHTSASEEMVIPFLQLPSKKESGADAYYNALEHLIYAPFYQYLGGYMDQDLKFQRISEQTIALMIEDGVAEFFMEDGDHLTVAKSMFPGTKTDHIFEICKVPQPNIDTSTGRFHYIISETTVNEYGSPLVIAYTLLAALQL